MKISSFVPVVLLVSVLLLSGCGTKKANTINYDRKFGKYITDSPQSTKALNTIDLSEGPKLRYDGNLGPQDVNFDFKIVNPY